MQDLIDKRVVVADSAGYMHEGDLVRIDFEHGLFYYVLANARTVNYVNMEEDPPSVDGWEVPGLVRIPVHLAPRIHLSHLDGSAGKSEVTKGSPKKRARKAAAT